MLIITSENDSGVSPTASKSLKNLYANTKFYHFTEGGHSPLLVKQNEYIKLVREHLQ
jgi:pimeloyl-ACP methyl ester carboxylesterase